MVDRHIHSHRRRGNQRSLKANCNNYEKRNGHTELHAPMSPIVSAREHSVTRWTPNTERVGAFSDGVFAVIITIMVLELKPPEHPSFAALALLWPTALSYAASYLFIAIIWVNHHYLLRLAEGATPQLIWWNFAHLFMVSLIPFSTAWIATSRMAAVPVFV